METHLKSKNAGAWPLIVAAVALLAVTMGSRSVFGLFLSPLNSATGIGIAAISFALAAVVNLPIREAPVKLAATAAA